MGKKQSNPPPPPRTKSQDYTRGTYVPIKSEIPPPPPPVITQHEAACGRRVVDLMRFLEHLRSSGVELRRSVRTVGRGVEYYTVSNIDRLLLDYVEGKESIATCSGVPEDQSER
jgi:hypothetical protein